MRPGMLEGGGGGMMMGLERPLEPPPPGAGHHPHNIMVSSHTPSISSGASTVGGGRVRFVRLIRRRNESYGFSLRGGREHGTGFFISHVEPGSEAHMQGLRAGDQVLRVNNLCVEQAIHREVTAMVQSKSSVILKVKSAGIIPVKEHRGDPLTWLVVDDDDDEEDLSDHVADTYSQSLPSTSSMHDGDLSGAFHPSASSPAASGSSRTLANPSANEGHARVIITCGGKMGLGCSICKGPPEKPGIFVQSVRAGGVAKTAGLRPGDQILACNDISFAHLEFAEAVYVLKSSPRLALDVLRGAGLDFVAGESSGYNSSASSVAGDQTPPSSSSDPRDSDHSVTSRLSAVSQHLTLDRSRGWREIEAEWADAEAAEKRRQLQSAQRTLKTRAQRDAHHRLSSLASRSLGNLSAALREEENEESTAFRDGGISPPYAHKPSNNPSSHILSPTHAHYKPTLRSTRSSSDVTDDTSHKIALVTSADPHVNNIVVSGGPKDEKDAVSRLEQLSSPSASRTSTLSSGASQVTVRSSSGSLSSATGGSGGSNSSKSVSPRITESVVEQQLRELREEQRKLQEEANRLAEERRKFEEEKRRGLERTQSAPLAPLVINCSGQSLPPHLQQSPPSPTSSIASGRHTTRVLIKSPPPPPPPRKNTTTLSSCHSHPHQVSPPASPAHSSSSSSGLGSLCGSGAPPRRCKSIGSLSASSSESTVWEDLPGSHLSSSINHSHCTFRSNMPPPPPPKPSAPLTPQVNNTNESKMLAGVPPPPPPPPPQSLSSNPQPSLADALTKELKRRTAQEAQATINGDDETKAKQIQDKIDAYKSDKRKSVPNDPKRAQHDKLMEEFKLAHRRMFDSKDNSVEEAKPEAKVQNHLKLTKTTSNNIEFNSKIISRMNQSTPVNSSNIKKPVPSIPNGNAVVNGNSKPSHMINDGSTPVNKWKEMLNSVPAASNKSNSVSSTPQQQNERPGGSTSKPSVVMKSPLRPTPGKVILVEDNKSVEKSSSPVWPPSSNSNTNQDRNSKFGKPAVEEYKSVEKSASPVWPPSSNSNTQLEKPGKSGKPLISIGTYPSPNNRPTPVKMDFLPSTSSVNVEANGTSRFAGSTREDLQNELTSTLTRSNIRQRLTAQELPLESPSPSISSSVSDTESVTSNSIVNGGFTTTIIHNNSSGPMASLSTKYKGIGQDASSATNSEGGSGRKECDEPESLPTGILKPSGPSTSIRPLQKSISFGDVTTVGEDDCR